MPSLASPGLEERGGPNAWDFCTSPDFRPKLDWIERFVEEQVLPLEPLLPELPADDRARLLDPLEDQVRAQGLWAAHLPKELGGQGFGQLALAQMNLITGRVGVAMEVFGNMAPDSGNAELLAEGGTPEQVPCLRLAQHGDLVTLLGENVVENGHVTITLELRRLTSVRRV